jgi:hypothetical protein
MYVLLLVIFTAAAASGPVFILRVAENVVRTSRIVIPSFLHIRRCGKMEGKLLEFQQISDAL